MTIKYFVFFHEINYDLKKYEQRPMPEKEFRTGLTDKFYLNFSKEDFEKLVLKVSSKLKKKDKLFI